MKKTFSMLVHIEAELIVPAVGACTVTLALSPSLHEFAKKLEVTSAVMASSLLPALKDFASEACYKSPKMLHSGEFSKDGKTISFTVDEPIDIPAAESAAVKEMCASIPML